MKRRVIKQGNNTLTITLPRKWAQKFGIKVGDELEVEERENLLNIFTEKEFKLESKEVDLSNFDLLIPRTIHALYKKGYDQLTIHFSDPKFLTLIQKAMGKETIGYEITKQGDTYCEIKSISEILKNEFDYTLRRIFLTLNLMAKDGLEAIKNNHLINLKNLQTLEETNNRLTTFCRRALNKYHYNKDKELTFLYCIVESLEKIADEYKYLYNFVIEKKGIKLSKETIKLYHKVNMMLSNFYNLFYEFKAEKAVEIAKERKEIIFQTYSLFKIKNREEIMVLHHLVIITQQIFNLLGPLIAINI